MRYSIEMVEWVDITTYTRKNPFEYTCDPARFYQIGIVLGEIVDKDTKLKLLRLAHRIGIDYDDLIDSEFTDIPLGNIIHRTKIGEIELREEFR
jgi:hypothetical protein